jgi:diacylglycerol kinase (ATP)
MREEEERAPAPSIGPARVAKAFGYSMAGLRSAWLTQAAFRQEVIAAAVLLPVAFLAPVAPLERVLLAASVLFVMVVELLNSAIEATVDRISREHHPLSGYAKDVGSAAVMLALVIAAMLWLAILGPVAVGWLA